MNDELIKILQEERNRLYPEKIAIASRGSCKMYITLIRMLRYIAYEHVCKIYKQLDYKVTLKQAHKDMDKFVSELLNSNILYEEE